MTTKEYLLFTLAAPMASFGTIAVGERRPTWDRPSKSQILGLIAGALGIERVEEERQHVLARVLSFAVRIDNPGQIATDYHTTQVPPARRNRHFATRADELAVDPTELKTILSRREFRVGSLYTIAVWHEADADPSLEDIAKALRTPGFVPFAGRKSHPLTLPMLPLVVRADDIGAAFNAYDAQETSAQRQFKADVRIQAANGHRPIYADGAGVPRQLIDRIEQRRDVPESRAKWRFGLRSEVLLKSQSSGGGT
jgi:CRISPR system Cascade subunit CasD